MSISQLLQPNGYNLNTNTLSIKNTILDSQGSQYTLVLPNDANIGPLSLLVIDSIVDDKVYLRFSNPINPPQAPFNIIECNELIAYVDVTSRSLTIDNVLGNTSNFIYNGLQNLSYQLPESLPIANGVLKSNSAGILEWTDVINGIDEITVRKLNATENINTEELEIKNAFQGGSIKFKLNTANQTEYILPNNLPTTFNDVLRCTPTGSMYWEQPEVNTTRNFIQFDNFPSDENYNGIILLNSEDISLLTNERYKVTVNLIASAGGVIARKFLLNIGVFDLGTFQQVSYLYQPSQLVLDSSNEFIPVTCIFIFTTNPSGDETRDHRFNLELNAIDQITVRGWYYDIQPF